MSTELIERLAREAGLVCLLDMDAASCVHSEGVDGVTADDLARFAALVAERCARIADSEYLTRPPGKHIRAAFPMPKD